MGNSVAYRRMVEKSGRTIDGHAAMQISPRVEPARQLYASYHSRRFIFWVDKKKIKS